jgi:hypothetical protein
MATIVIYLAPAVGHLSDSVADKKEQDDCFDQYTGQVTDTNAAVLAANAASLWAIGVLVIDLSVQPRDAAIIDVDKERIRNTGANNATAVAAYNAAIAARAAYAAAHRPLPCPLSPDN